MLGMVVVGGLLLLLMIWFYYDCQVSGQMDCNVYLEVEIEKVKEQNKEIDCFDVQKEWLLVCKKVIEELQVKCLQMVYLFDVLVCIIFDGVVLIVLKQEGDVLMLEGCIQFNVCVLVYMCNLEIFGWMINLELLIIEVCDLEKDKDGKVGLLVDIKVLFYVFVVKVKLLVQSEEVLVMLGLNVDGLVVMLVLVLVVLLVVGLDVVMFVVLVVGQLLVFVIFVVVLLVVLVVLVKLN